MDWTYPASDVLDRARIDCGQGWGKVTVDVQDGETSYLPGSSKRPIYGPARVTYMIHATGVQAQIHELPRDLVLWRSLTHGEYKCTPETLAACMAYFASYTDERLLAFAHNAVPGAHFSGETRFCLLVMLADFKCHDWAIE